jgi:hypothetical protein
MIKENFITDRHIIPEHIAGLIIANPIPRLGLIGTIDKVINAKGLGLRFHQPIFHAVDLS